MSEHIYAQLQARGYLAQVTNEEEVREYLGTPNATYYVGFDPTADSLTVGHLIPLMVMAHIQQAGARPIALMGGGTGHIGDPSGRTDLRNMMTPEIISYNISCFARQINRIFDFTKDGGIVVDNADWLLKLNYVEFIRDIGRHFSVNRMLTAECYKQRLAKGLTFLEFNYMLMQAYDFLMLYRQHNCCLQIGGDDQWSNIIAGADLIRRLESGKANGLTLSLLTTSSGAKMGKSAKGAVWLDKNKYPIYDFYQYFRNVDDADVVRFMKLLTFMPLDEINEYNKLSGAALNEAKERLAYEVTALVHGVGEAEKANAMAQSLFGNKSTSASAPEVIVSAAEMDHSLLQILADHKLVPSRSEARRILNQGGLYLNDQAVSDIGLKLGDTGIKAQKPVMLRIGKKKHYQLLLKD